MVTAFLSSFDTKIKRYLSGPVWSEFWDAPLSADPETASFINRLKIPRIKDGPVLLLHDLGVLVPFLLSFLTTHSDLLTMSLEATRRLPDLKLIVTSATLGAEKSSKYIFECPIFSIPGRTYPVDILYTKEAETDHLDALLMTII